LAVAVAVAKRVVHPLACMPLVVAQVGTELVMEHLAKTLLPFPPLPYLCRVIK
jgi:hypothetical protein